MWQVSDWIAPCIYANRHITLCAVVQEVNGELLTF